MKSKRLLFSTVALLMVCAQFSFAQECVINCPPNLTVCAGSSTNPAFTGYAFVTTGSGTGIGTGFGNGVNTGSGTSDLDCIPYIISSSDYVTKNAACPGALFIQRTWTATNPNDPNETTSCVQTITQSDIETPTFSSCPSDITIESDNDNCEAVGTWEHPSAYDNCGIAQIFSNYNPGSIFPTGQTIVTYTAVDNCGNTTTCSFSVNVICGSGGTDPGTDPGAPLANCGSDSLSYGNVHFSLDHCQSYLSNQSNQDFSEFTSTINVAGDQDCMILSSTILSRNNPQTNSHSCTAGVFDTPAMCVGMSKDCVYEADSDQAVRFAVSVDPLLGNSRIDHLEFYELAPTHWAFIDGDTGLNDYPTRYALRVTANDVEIFHQFDIPTTQEWSREFFDFSNNPAFEVDTYTMFEFQLTAYCSILGNSAYSVWDLDAISVNASCGDPTPEDLVSGGTLTGGPFEFCYDNTNSYFIEEDEIVLSGNNGSEGRWVVTNSDGLIIDLPSSPYDVDFASIGNHQSLIYFVSYNPSLTGLTPGYSIHSQIVGCYGISNPITVTGFSGTSCPGNSVQNDDEGESDFDIETTQNEFVTMFDFKLYPNPTESRLTVDISGVTTEVVDIELTDSYGKHIKSLSKNLNDSETFVLDVTDLAGGIYLIKISNGRNALYKKFIKVN